MRHRNYVLGEGDMAQSLDDRLLKDLARLCSAFREGDYDANPDDTGVFARLAPLTAHGLNTGVRSLLDMFPHAAFTKGMDALAVRKIPEPPQALFYCFVELFLAQPISPVDKSFFGSAPAFIVFKEGLDTLLGKGLVIAVTVNSPDESKARKDRYILSPHACARLFRGRDDLVSASVAVQFGTVVPWTGIRDKELLFPDDLRDNLRLISKAVSRDCFETVRQNLQRNGLRNGLTFLLSGPPGTGKTEFVRQLARSERRNIFLVDAAKMDGSYFGEKPRNLRDLFLFSRYMSAIMVDEPILFIDEADSLLGRRVEATKSSDREENLSSNIILEELNAFSGILFAATNNYSGLDPAMIRRFLFRTEFPVPAPAVQARIWRSKLPFLTDDEAADLAGRFSLSGGLMDNVASLCLLERIVYGKDPSYDQLLRHCESQVAGTAKATKKIGF